MVEDPSFDNKEEEEETPWEDDKDNYDDTGIKVILAKIKSNKTESIEVLLIE